MFFETILGNEKSLARLKGIAAGGRPAHAYLFSGPEGIGKKLAAGDFVRALAARPLVVSRLEDKQEISIAQIHEVLRELSFTSLERRAVIVDDAHRMSDEAMNACLKTLEEPPAGVIVILVTSVPQRLLDTIRSRCQTIFFFPLADETLRRHAIEKLHCGEEESRLVALLSGGSPGAAAKVAAELEDVLAAAREIQTRVLAGELNPVIEALGKIRDMGRARDEARRTISLLVHCLREALLSKTGYRPCLALPAFVEHAARLDDEALIERIETLLDHERAIDLNANVGLALEDALLRL